MPKVAELGFHVGHRPVSKKKLKEEEISLLQRPLFLCIRWADSSKPLRLSGQLDQGCFPLCGNFGRNGTLRSTRKVSGQSGQPPEVVLFDQSVLSERTLPGFGKALEKHPAGDEVEQIQFLILFAYKLMIGYSRKNRENYPIECFW